MRRLRRCIRRSAARRIKDSLLSTMSVGLVLASSSAFAQNPPPPKPDAPTTKADEVELPGVDVQGQRQPEYKGIQSDNYKLPDLLKDTPQSITVVPQRIIREEAVFNLRDALRNVTGISLAAGEGGGAQGDNLTLRGFSARNDIFTDGVRDFGQYTRDTFDLESVEVLKGPSSVLFGRGSTGGVINQVTKAPNLRPNYTFTGTEGTGPFSRAAVDINQPVADTAAFRLNDMFTDAGVVDRDETHLRRWGAAAILHHRAGDANPVQRQLLLLRRQQPARLRLPLRLRQASRRQPEQLLRPDRPRLREGPGPHRHLQGRARDR
jgi:catecholate siderophore receptor